VPGAAERRPHQLAVAHAQVEDGAGQVGDADRGAVAEIAVPHHHRRRWQLRELLVAAEPLADAQPARGHLPPECGVPLAGGDGGDPGEHEERDDAGREPAVVLGAAPHSIVE
jgi:hypothetical protein